MVPREMFAHLSSQQQIWEGWLGGEIWEYSLGNDPLETAPGTWGFRISKW